MKVLHIVRRPGDERALGMAQAQAAAHEVAVLLLHGAVLDEVAFAGEVYACREDVEGRGGQAQYPLLDYDGIVALIGAYDRVIAW